MVCANAFLIINGKMGSAFLNFQHALKTNTMSTSSASVSLAIIEIMMTDAFLVL